MQMSKTTKATKPKLKVASAQGYCRKCRKVMTLDSNFYEATNPMIDTNGYLSVCKKCCAEIYETYFAIYNNIETAIELTCRDLDIRFSKDSLTQTLNQIEKMVSKGKKTNAVFGIYKSKLMSTTKSNDKIDSFRYKDSDNLNYDIEDDVFEENPENKELVLFWGRGFSPSDYEFLEMELANWKQTHKCDNHADEVLLREICIKILEIRNKRAKGGDVGGLQKELQDLMKTASVDPAKANTASAGKIHDTWGVWIKDIEQFRPAEWHDQQEKYKDMDGLIPYIKDYIVRPIRNFITGNRDFQLSDNINVRIDDGELN